ncbi:MAG TPA: TraB/GumN family protein [Burkholderiales bacterium]|nr:TraB/GumN family protein [Burkholderiales bacterium]
MQHASLLPRISGLVGAAFCAVAIAFPACAEVRQPETRFTKGLLWRVSKTGTAPSHVFGTIHVADPRVLDIPDPVNRALVRSRRYYAESFQGEREAMRFFEAGQFEDGRRLEPLIGAEAYAKLVEVLHERQVPEDVIARLKPWAALANVTVTPEDYEGVTLDQKLVELARARGLRVLGLEGVEEQIAVFDRIPLDTQVALLKHALGHRDDLASLLEPAIQAWMKRDLAGIHFSSTRAAERYPEVAEHYRILFKRIIENRSIVMAHRLFVPLREGGAFIAVGANHLYGTGGMLALIESQGYRVERVY